MLGYQATEDSVNNNAGRIWLNLANAFQDVHDFHNWLVKKPDQDLLDIGFTAADLLALRNAYDDLYILWEIEQGITISPADARQGTVYDFRTLTVPLTGGQTRA